MTGTSTLADDQLAMIEMATDVERLEGMIEILKQTNAILVEELAARRREVQELHALLERVQSHALGLPRQKEGPGV